MTELNLKGRHFLKEADFTPEQWTGLLDLSAALKSEDFRFGRDTHRNGHLAGLVIALIFEKTSTRTRCAFEVAAFHEGARVTFLDPASSQIGHKESIADTAKVLARFYDGIEWRGSAHTTVEELAANSSVPVWNGLSDSWHPTQTLADQLTLREVSGKADSDIAFAFVGDARNNVARSLLVGGAMLGQDVRLVAPTSLQPAGEPVELAHEIAAQTGARITITDDLDAVEGVDGVYADVWVSMGEKKEAWAERISVLTPYRVTSELMEKAGSGAHFLHCLPAFHDFNTTVAQDIHNQLGVEPFEVSDDVFLSERSVVFQQAENRMHTIKAVMVATAGH